MKTNLEKSIRIFKALSEITRLKIIWLLLNIDSKICVSEIIEVLDVPQYNVSRHLKILSNAGLLGEIKEGKWVFYYINKDDSEFMYHVENAINSISDKDMIVEIQRCRQRLLERNNL